MLSISQYFHRLNEGSSKLESVCLTRTYDETSYQDVNIPEFTTPNTEDALQFLELYLLSNRKASSLKIDQHLTEKFSELRSEVLILLLRVVYAFKLQKIPGEMHNPWEAELVAELQSRGLLLANILEKIKETTHYPQSKNANLVQKHISQWEGTRTLFNKVRQTADQQLVLKSAEILSKSPLSHVVACSDPYCVLNTNASLREAVQEIDNKIIKTLKQSLENGWEDTVYLGFASGQLGRETFYLNEAYKGTHRIPQKLLFVDPRYQILINTLFSVPDEKFEAHQKLSEQLDLQMQYKAIEQFLKWLAQISSNTEVHFFSSSDDCIRYCKQSHVDISVATGLDFFLPGGPIGYQTDNAHTDFNKLLKEISVQNAFEIVKDHEENQVYFAEQEIYSSNYFSSTVRIFEGSRLESEISDKFPLEDLMKGMQTTFKMRR